MDISFPCRLPSLGRLYSNFPDDGIIHIKPLRGQHEEALSGASGKNANVVLQQITSQLSVLPSGFAFQDLLVSDWVAITFAIMSVSYSDVLTLSLSCPKCSHDFIQNKYLADLECKLASDFEQWKEPFLIDELPGSKSKLEFKLIRLRDLEQIQDYAEQSKSVKMQAGDPTYIYSLSKIIWSIDGNTNMSDLEKMKWLRQALAKDLRTIKASVERQETGFNLKPRFCCPMCEYVFQTRMPIDFFRAFGADS